MTTVSDEEFSESGSVVNLGQSIENRYDRRHFGDDSSNSRKNDFFAILERTCVVDSVSKKKRDDAIGCRIEKGAKFGVAVDC
jgi:hypothetical protein